MFFYLFYERFVDKTIGVMEPTSSIKGMCVEYINLISMIHLHISAHMTIRLQGLYYRKKCYA